MMIAIIVLALAFAAPQNANPQDVPVLKANLGGDCSADFQRNR